MDYSAPGRSTSNSEAMAKGFAHWFLTSSAIVKTEVENSAPTRIKGVKRSFAVTPLLSDFKLLCVFTREEFLVLRIPLINMRAQIVTYEN